MTEQPPRFRVEPWCLRETHLDLSALPQTESLFALSNGHIGVRGNLDEGEPHGLPGTYLNSFYELRPLPYAEAGYGYPEAGQSVVNVTNGKLIRLLVDDEPFDLRYGELLSHERVLDFRSGLLTRTARWRSPAGREVRVRSRRLVSFSQRAIVAIDYSVEPLNGDAQLIVQSELVANEALPPQSDDPRTAAVLERPLESIEHVSDDDGAVLVHRTRQSQLQMAAAMDHVIEAPGRSEVDVDTKPDWARTTVVCAVPAGKQLRLIKYVAYGWSSQRSVPSLRDQVSAALTGARYTTFEGLADQQRAYLDEFWDGADVELDGDDEIQQAVRFGLFHVLQAAARAERRAIPAKGLTGPGYDGHTFWDSEGFVLPTLAYTHPPAAAGALRWRYDTLDLARERAAQLGLAGATFPWRTIRGQECSGYWPAGTAGFHINADIADAFEHYRVVTGDNSLEAEVGVDVLVETARLWMSLGHHDRQGRWHVDGVTGPDEYSALADDNVFTNLMAARNLEVAADAADRHPESAARLGVGRAETDSWRAAAEAVHVPYDETAQVHPQSDLFTRYREWDFDRYRDKYPLLLHAPYVTLYRSQVVKQADLVLAMQRFGERFTLQQKARNFDYYERRTVRDSSLSACTQAVVAAAVGQLELAHDYTYEAALMDIADLHHNTGDGLHMASLAGAWIALVAGFGGLRGHDGVLSFDPVLPAKFQRLRFTLHWQSRRVHVDVSRTEATYALSDGQHGEITLRHANETVSLHTGQPVTRPVSAREPLLPRPPQPAGRRPPQRGTGS
jgi:trehalose/maltose hydrolase-like predicted phosphorylase